MPLPPRTADTMSDAIALSSPNGRMSKRARAAAEKRLAEQLFGPGGGTRQQIMGEGPPQRSKRERDLAWAANLRRLAASGQSPRKFIKAAEKIEAQWADPATP